MDAFVAGDSSIAGGVLLRCLSIRRSGDLKHLQDRFCGLAPGGSWALVSAAGIWFGSSLLRARFEGAVRC